MSIVLLFVHILEYLLLMYIIIHTRVAHWAQAQFTLLTVCSYYLYKTSSLMSTYKDPLLYNYRHAHTNTHYSFIFSIYIKMDILFGFWIMGVDLFQASFGRREWNGMKRIILEYFFLPLFGSFNGGNGKFIPLFGSLSERKWNG